MCQRQTKVRDVAWDCIALLTRKEQSMQYQTMIAAASESMGLYKRQGASDVKVEDGVVVD